MAGGRPRRKARRDVDGVSHHRIPPAVRRSDRRGEHRAPADAGLHRQGRLGFDDVPQRQQQPLLVLADHPRNAGAQPDLAAIGGDVGIEEADFVAIGRLLHEPDELIEAPRRRHGPLSGDQLVEAPETDERNSSRSVLGRDRSLQEMRSHRGR